MSAALTHVCMWKDNNWKRISAEEAKKIYPRGRSARYETFICELCNQYVVLVNGRIQKPHFRHSSSEENKECDDRREIFSNTYKNVEEAKMLPLKMKFDDRGKLSFMIGFTPLPESLIKNVGSFRISINNYYVYDNSRLNNSLTYLDVGSFVSSKYSIKTLPRIDKIDRYWPSEVEGVSPEGTLFDAATGKKLPYDADIQVNKKYHILSKYRISTLNQDISLKQVFHNKGYFVFEVSANRSSEYAAKFFLRYHCRLTIDPVSMYPIWPPFIETPYIVYTNKTKLYFSIRGRIDNIEPQNYVKAFPLSEPHSLLSVDCNNEQTNLSVGRLGILRYLSIRKGEITNQNDFPNVSVTDINGNEISLDEHNIIPKKNIICILAKYDGFIEVTDKNNNIEKIDIKANEKLEIDNIKFGKTIKIYQGLDKIWETNYIRSEIDNNTESIIMKELNRCIGNKVSIPHSFGAIVAKYHDMPEVKNWIYKRIREGYIEEKALKLLKKNIVG